MIQTNPEIRDAGRDEVGASPRLLLPESVTEARFRMKNGRHSRWLVVKKTQIYANRSFGMSRVDQSV